MRYMVRCGTVIDDAKSPQDAAEKAVKDLTEILTSSVCRPVIEVQPVDNDLNPLGKIETIDLMDFL